MKIFSETGCISKETMYKYLDGKLDGRDKHLVEKHLTDCELCSDELEGLSYIKDRERAGAIVEELKQEIREKTGKKNRGIIFFDFNTKRAVAAAAAIIIIAGSVYILSDITGNEQKQISENVAAQPEETADKKTKGSFPASEEEEKNNEIKEKEIDQVLAKSTGSTEQVAAEAQQKDISGRRRQDNMDRSRSLKDADDDDKFAFSENLAEQKEEITGDEDNIISTRGAEGTGKTDDIAGGIIDYETVTLPVGADETQMDYKMVAAEEIVPEEESVREEADARIAALQKPVYEDLPVMELAEVKTSHAKKSEKEKAGKKGKLAGRTTTISGISQQDTVDNAQARYNAGDYAGVIDLLTEYTISGHDNYNAIYYLGLSYYNLGEYDNAITQFNKIIALETVEYNEDALWHKSLSLIQLNDTVNVRGLLQEIIQKQGKYKSEAEQALEELE